VVCTIDRGLSLGPQSTIVIVGQVANDE